LIQDELESGLAMGADDEAKETCGRADHCDPEGARGRDEDGRGVPQAWDQRGELAKYGGLEISKAKRLKGLDSENARLKKLLADATRPPMLVPQWPNDRWSLDFVADQFIDRAHAHPGRGR
jgi:hypothetical protein